MNEDQIHSGRNALALCSPRGTTLIESVVALFMVSMILFGIAQMVGFGMLAHRVSEDLTAATVLAEHKLEELENTDFDTLIAGGSTAVETAGFFDSPDVDGDGTPDYSRRWRVQDVAGGKVINVRVVSPLATSGPPKDAVLVALIAES
jgi:hypothetical protein